jgi:hypothetical protein
MPKGRPEFRIERRYGYDLEHRGWPQQFVYTKRGLRPKFDLKQMPAKAKQARLFIGELERDAGLNLANFAGKKAVSEKQRAEICGRLKTLLEKSKSLPPGNRAYFLDTLEGFTREMVSADLKPEMVGKMAAFTETVFNLMSRHGKGSNLGIRFKPEHRWPGNFIVVPVLAVRMRIPPDKTITARPNPRRGIFNIEFDRFGNLKLALVQSTGYAEDVTRKVLGERWYVALTDELIRCAKPLFESGGTIVLANPVVLTGESIKRRINIYGYLRDRYFTSSAKWSSPLNPRRERVKKLLGKGADTVPDPGLISGQIKAWERKFSRTAGPLL